MKEKQLAGQHAREVERALIVLTRVGLIDWQHGENEAMGRLDVRISNMTPSTTKDSPLFHVNGREITPASKPLVSAVSKFWMDQPDARPVNTRAEAAAAGRGFSLLELLIAVGIILVITAIALPSLLASRRASYQSSAVQSITTLNKAVQTYINEFPDGEGTGTSTTFTKMAYSDLFGGTANCTATPPVISPTSACILDPVLGAANAAATPKDNYVMTLAVTNPGTWTINADPVAGDLTGNTKHFYVDNTNVIRYSLGAPATAASTPVGQ